jgi:hypothetical protein
MEVAVDVETIRITTVIVGMSMISAVVMAIAAMIIRIMVVVVATMAAVMVAMVVVVVAMVVVVEVVVRIKVAAPMKLGKVGHTALNCWKRHQKNYRGQKNLLALHMDPMELTPTDTLILVQLIISQENWRSYM